MPLARRNNLLSIPTSLRRDGSPMPEAIPQNLASFGYACPRHQYVESPVPVMLSVMAKQWKITAKTLGEWAREQDWRGQRERYWQRMADDAGNLSATQLAETRNREILTRYQGWEHIRSGLMASVQRGGKDEQSATGAVKFTPFGPGDWKQIAEAKERIERNIDSVLDMSRTHNSLVKQGQEEKSTNVRRSLVYNLTITEVEEQKDPRDGFSDSYPEAALQEPNTPRFDADEVARVVTLPPEPQILEAEFVEVKNRAEK